MPLTDFAFLPDFPPAMNAVALFGAFLLAGLLGGLVARRLRLPTITGYVLVGMFVGDSGLALFTPELLAQARVFVDISLGLILFDLGRRLDFAWLRKDRFLFFSGMSESALTFVLIYVVLHYAGVPKLFAAVAAAIGISTSPSVVMLIAQEQRAEGQVTERALNLVAMNNVIAFVVVTMLLAALYFEYRASVVTMVLHPLYLLVGSVLLGIGAWRIALRLGRALGKREDRQFVMLIALVVLTVGCANLLKLSVLLALLVFGVLLRNYDRRHDVMPVSIGSRAELFYTVLFVVTGAMLDAKQLLTGGAIAVAYVAARFAGKILGVLPWAMMSGLAGKRAAMLGLMLTPMAGFAVVLVQDIWRLYPEFHRQALAVVISAVILLEIAGPVVVHYTLRLSGEAHPQKDD